jgi:CDP-glycerol glycerophosphotransferase (TagB/SpsB family)
MVRSVVRAAGRRVYERWSREPVRQAVFLESFEGTGMGGDPGAIAQYLLAETDLPLVWALRSPRPATARVRFVRYRSPAYFRALATSQYLVTNVTFPPMFAKRPDQVYLNTWHGTPLKRMGRDVQAPFTQMANTVANLAAADVLLSSSDYMTDTMYAGAYGLDTHSVLRLGTPRVDRQFGAPAKDLVVYAPTWQEASYTEAVDDTEALVVRMSAIARVVDRPVLRGQTNPAPPPAADTRLQPYLLDGDTNEILGRARIVITDFSSVAFDALATGSTVLFFTPDPYARGVYLSDEELPGPRTASLGELQEWLRDPPVRDQAPLRDRFCPDEDGRATHRAVRRLLTLP